MTTTLGEAATRLDAPEPQWSVDTSTTFVTTSGAVEVSCVSEAHDTLTAALVENLFFNLGQIEDAELLQVSTSTEANETRDQLSSFLLEHLGVRSDPTDSAQALQFRLWALARRRRSSGQASGAADDPIRLWVDLSGFGSVMDELDPQLRSFPTPLYGSPPESWRPLSQLVGGTGVSLVTVGTLATTGHPVLAVVLPFSAFICWMAAPAAKIARRSLATRAARALGTRVKPEDLK